MNESNQAGSETPNMSDSTRTSQAAWFSNWLREGADKAAESLRPPHNVAKHFREARLELLRGVRELIDHRIERLSKDQTKGSRIVVE